MYIYYEKVHENYAYAKREREREEMENMPPGYRFYPTEEELIKFYLHNKLEGEKEYMNRVIPVINIYDYNPTQLPQISGEASLRDTEQWFFFIPRQESEVRGGRPKRLTTTGYWKATGTPNHVYSSDNHIIGMKRTMVFYSGRAPNGKKTDWKMNEYKAIIKVELQPSTSNSQHPTPKLRQEFSLCRVYKKSKCLRAFDRRPPPRRFTAHSSKEIHNRHDAAAAESSSSREHGQLSHEPDTQMDNNNNNIVELLDWEQVDRFLGLEP